jgi:hypothetical protein
MIVREGKRAIDSRHKRKLVIKIVYHGRPVWTRPNAPYLFFGPQTMWLMPSNKNTGDGEVISNVEWNIN